MDKTKKEEKTTKPVEKKVEKKPVEKKDVAKKKVKETGEETKTKRRFVLLDKDGSYIGTYKGHSPMQIATKAARRGHTDIRIRETKTKKILHYKGRREAKEIAVTDKSPEWMRNKAVNGKAKIYTGFAEKIKEE